ncbi:MAG: CsbD family protein [Chthoniobacterales bacterium]
MNSSSKDKIKGGFNEAKGKIKEKTGEAVGNPDLRDRGTAEKVGGKVQSKVGDVKKVFGK